jgi:uncharacterized protein
VDPARPPAERTWPPPPVVSDRVVAVPQAAHRPERPDERARLPGRALVPTLGGLVMSFGGSATAAVAVGAATGVLLAALLAGQALLWGGLVGTTWYVSRRYGTGNLRRDYQFRSTKRDIVVGVGLSFVLRLAAVVAAGVVVVLLGTDEGVPDQLEMLDDDRVAMVVFMGLAVIGAPVVEELYFRGLLLQVLTPLLRPPGAIVAQGLLFGAVHALTTGTLMQNLILVSALSGAGVVLGITVQVTKRLGPAVWAHIWFNAVSLLLVTVL